MFIVLQRGNDKTWLYFLVTFSLGQQVVADLFVFKISLTSCSNKRTSNIIIYLPHHHHHHHVMTIPTSAINTGNQNIVFVSNSETNKQTTPIIYNSVTSATNAGDQKIFGPNA